MAKRPLKLTIRIPMYAHPRNTWREAIHGAVATRQAASLVRYEPSDKLEVSVRLYFTNKNALAVHDVDNRLKDCMDALQGRVGGTKSKAWRRLSPIIPNDSQIWRVTIEKRMAPKQALGRGHLRIRRLSRI